MCTLDNIKLGSAAIFTIRLILGLFLMIIGGIFANTSAIVQAYGVYFIEAGAGVVMMGFTTLLFAYPMLFAIRRHNRFVLLMCIFIDLIIFSQEISVGLKCYAPTIPKFSTDLADDCAQNIPQKYTSEECLVYWRDDTTAGFRIVWASLFTTVRNEDSFQTLSDFETLNGCCGFGPPMACKNDSRPFPSNRPIDEMHTRYQKQRVTCGNMPGFYTKQVNCLDYYDENSLPPIIGGCRYDMGASTCRKEDVTQYSKGCALAVATYVASQVRPLSILLIGMSAITFLCLLVNTCMFWKRKDTDVFPEFINVDEKKSKWSNYHRIKDNVVVIPTKDYLYLRGFLPKEHMKHLNNNNNNNNNSSPQHEEKKEEIDQISLSVTSPNDNNPTSPTKEAPNVTLPLEDSNVQTNKVAENV